MHWPRTGAPSCTTPEWPGSPQQYGCQVLRGHQSAVIRLQQLARGRLLPASRVTVQSRQVAHQLVPAGQVCGKGARPGSNRTIDWRCYWGLGTRVCAPLGSPASARHMKNSGAVVHRTEMLLDSVEAATCRQLPGCKVPPQ